MAELELPETTQPQDWTGLGIARVTGFLPKDRFDALAAEAHASAERAEPYEREAITGHRDGSITSPQRCHVHPGGDALIELVRHPALAEVACEATGSRAMTAIRYGYKWYVRGDHMQVHRDEGKCEITFSAGLVGDLGTMGWLPAYGG